MKFAEELGKTLIRANKLGLRNYAARSERRLTDNYSKYRRDSTENNKPLRVQAIGKVEACNRSIK